ncbi:hypothetical protein MF1_11060 [Bartonella quintana]|nr:hypothetical protein MF1_11060 [Bartonella quintana]
MASGVMNAERMENLLESVVEGALKNGLVSAEVIVGRMVADRMEIKMRSEG